MFQNYLKTSKNTKIIINFLSEMSPQERLTCNSNRQIVMDLVPFLNLILQPNIRPVAVQLLSKTEKEKFDNLTNIMISFNVGYRQEKGADGQFNFVLEP